MYNAITRATFLKLALARVFLPSKDKKVRTVQVPLLGYNPNFLPFTNIPAGSMTATPAVQPPNISPFNFPPARPLWRRQQLENLHIPFVIIGTGAAATPPTSVVAQLAIVRDGAEILWQGQQALVMTPFGTSTTTNYVAGSFDQDFQQAIEWNGESNLSFVIGAAFNQAIPGGAPQYQLCASLGNPISTLNYSRGVVTVADVE